VFSLVGSFFWVAVITLQPLLPLPPYARSSRATPDKVLLVLSVVVGRTGAFTLPAPPHCAVFFFLFWRASTPPQGLVFDSLYPD
jgi:hypothetical protein